MIDRNNCVKARGGGRPYSSEIYGKMDNMDGMDAMDKVDRRAEISNAWGAFVRQPDEEHFRALHDAAVPLVWTICRRMLRCDDDARDAMQAAWVRLFLLAQHPDFKSKPYSDDEAHQLISRTAAREADALRHRLSRRAQKEISMGDLPLKDSGGASPSEIAAARETRTRLETLVQTLPDKYRVPVLLHYFDGLTQAQIAGMLGLTPAGVSLRLKRALKKLTPLAHRAGLGEAFGIMGGAGLAGAALLMPPAAVSAAEVWLGVQTAVASGAVSLGAGAAIAGGAKGGIAAGILKFKVGLAAVVLGGAAMVALPLFQPGEALPPPRAVSAPMMTEVNPALLDNASQTIMMPNAAAPEAEADIAQTGTDFDGAVPLDSNDPDNPLPPANLSAPAQDLQSTLANLPGAILPPGESKAAKSSQARKVTARLAFDGPVSQEVIDQYKYARLTRSKRRWWDYVGADGDSLDEDASAEIRNGEFAFTGRFRGKYNIQLGIQTGSVSYLDPVEFTINNTRKDVDLGAIRLSARAGVKIQYEFDTSSIQSPPEFMSFYVVLIDSDTKSPVECFPLAYRADTTSAEQVIVAEKPGSYYLFPHSPGWKLDGEAPQLNLTLGDNSLPVFKFRMIPTGLIHGYFCHLENGQYRWYELERVTLTGPDGLFREVTQTKARRENWLWQYAQLWKGKDYLMSQEYAFTNLTAGEYELTFYPTGMAPINRSITVKPGESSKHECFEQPN